MVVFQPCRSSQKTDGAGRLPDKVKGARPPKADQYRNAAPTAIRTANNRHTVKQPNGFFFAVGFFASADACGADGGEAAACSFPRIPATLE